MKTRYLAAAGIAAALLLISLFWFIDKENKDSISEESLYPEVTEAIKEEESVREEEELWIVCELSQAERVLVDAIYSCMEQTDYEGAARILNDNQEQLQVFFYSTMNSEDWLYDGNQLTNHIAGTGLVFRRPTSVFYGNFQEGYPEGEGIALQAVYLPAGRYDYAYGNWSLGKLDGEGVCGYRYYEEPEEGELLETKKEGVFSEDVMTGQVTYTSVNKDEEVTVWQLEVVDGVTVRSEAWSYNENKHEYQLFSEGDGTRAFVLAETSFDEVLWKNLLTYE